MANHDTWTTKGIDGRLKQRIHSHNFAGFVARWARYITYRGILPCRDSHEILTPSMSANLYGLLARGNIITANGLACANYHLS